VCGIPLLGSAQISSQRTKTEHKNKRKKQKGLVQEGGGAPPIPARLRRKRRKEVKMNLKREPIQKIPY